MSPRVAALALVACAGVLGAACSSSPPAHRADTTTTSHHRHATSTSTSTSKDSTTSTTAQAPGNSKPPTGPASTTTTVAAASSDCNRMSASAGQTTGAAGTIVGVITVTNAGSGTCTAVGYPTMALYGSGGSPITVTMVNGLSVNYSPPANGAPTSTTIGPSASAQFAYQISDVVAGIETCPTSASASVTIPGASTPTPNFSLAITPCNHGTIRVSPLYSTG